MRQTRPQITGGNVVYTAGGTAGADTCWVRVCETCGSTPVCSVTALPYEVIQP